MEVEAAQKASSAAAAENARGRLALGEQEGAGVEPVGRKPLQTTSPGCGSQTSNVRSSRVLGSPPLSLLPPIGLQTPPIPTLRPLLVILCPPNVFLRVYSTLRPSPMPPHHPHPCLFRTELQARSFRRFGAPCGRSSLRSTSRSTCRAFSP